MQVRPAWLKGAVFIVGIALLAGVLDAAYLFSDPDLRALRADPMAHWHPVKGSGEEERSEQRGSNGNLFSEKRTQAKIHRHIAICPPLKIGDALEKAEGAALKEGWEIINSDPSDFHGQRTGMSITVIAIRKGSCPELDMLLSR